MIKRIGLLFSISRDARSPRRGASDGCSLQHLRGLKNRKHYLCKVWVSCASICLRFASLLIFLLIWPRVYTHLLKMFLQLKLNIFYYYCSESLNRIIFSQKASMDRHCEGQSMSCCCRSTGKCNDAHKPRTMWPSSWQQCRTVLSNPGDEVHQKFTYRYSHYD